MLRFSGVLFTAIGLGCSDSVAPVGLGTCNPPASGAWTYLGLEGQWVTALADTPWGLYVGTGDNGVFRCSPETNTWEPLGLDHAQVATILFVPGAISRIFVGVRPYADEQTAAAVFATEDRGRIWLPWDGGLASQHGNRQWAYSLAMDPHNPERLYMGQSFPLLRSQDGGRSWQYVFGGPDMFGLGIKALVVSPDQSGRVYAAGTTAFFSAAILRSENWGDTWETVFPFPQGQNSVFALAVDEREPMRIWAGVGGGVIRSDDAGRTWQQALSTQGLITSILAESDRLYAVGGAFRQESDPLTDLVIYRSDDRGANWSAFTVPSNIGGSDVAVLDSHGHLLIGTGSKPMGGVWRFDP
jgi:photosystem II stability/assembly factor-like uncharacterized protein